MYVCISTHNPASKARVAEEGLKKKASAHTHTGMCAYTSTRKASWNLVGVEPVHRKPADINPGSLKWVIIRKYFSSELMVQIKQKGVYGVETLLPRNFLGGRTHILA